MGIALFPTLGSLATPEATGTAFNSWPRQNQRGGDKEECSSRRLFFRVEEGRKNKKEGSWL